MNFYKPFLILSLAAAAGISTTSAQSITTIIIPGIMHDSSSTVPAVHGSRTPFVYRAKLSGLAANTWYRYFSRAVVSSDSAKSKGSGNQIFINKAGVFRYSASANPGFFNPLNFDSLLTDSVGEYTGWFGIEARADARFAASLTPPNTRGVKMRIILNDGTPGNTVATHFLTTADSVLLVKYGNGFTQGTAIFSLSGAPDKDFVFLYGEAAGTSRPISGTVIESDGISYTGFNPNPANYPAYYKNSVDGISGAWGTIIPNLPAFAGGTGIKRIERRHFSDGTIAMAHSDNDGVWPTGGVNTLGPSGGFSAPLQIAFKDAPLVDTMTNFNFSVKQISVAENVNGGSATFYINIKYPKANSYSVDVAVAGGSAVAGTDYTFTSPTNISFPIGSGIPQLVIVNITDDCVKEGPDTIILRLSNPTGGAVIGEDSLIYIIITNDDDPTFSFSATRQTIKEDKDSVMLTVNLNCPQASALTVDVAIGAGGSAVQGQDYSFPPVTTLNFPAGQTTYSFWIPIINDALPEGSDVFFMKLQNPSGGALLTKATDTIIILNDDFNKYKINQVHGENAQGGADSNGVRVAISGIVYGYNLAAQPGQAQFTLRDRTGGIGVFGNDFGYKVNEGDSVEVRGTIGQARGYTRIQNLDTIIFYSDLNPLKTAVRIDTLNESTESDLVQLEYAAFINQPFMWPGDDTVTVMNMITGKPVKVFVDGETDLAGTLSPTGFFRITGLGWQQGNFPVLLSGYRLVPRYATDVEALLSPEFYIDSAATATNISENGTATIRVMMLNTQPVAMQVTLSAGGTANSSDYTFTNPQTITFPANSNTAVPVSIAITDDALTETTESIILTLTNPSGGGTVSGGSKTINILDNDNIGTGRDLNEPQFSLYPNPAGEELQVKLSGRVTELTTVNMLGVEIVLPVKSKDAETVSFDLSALPAGMYFLKINTADGMYMKRFMKN